MSAVTLRTYRHDEKKSYEGDGFKINNKWIIAHYNTLGLKPNELSSSDWQRIPLCIRQVVSSRYRMVQTPLRIVHVWQCSSFQKYFQTFFKIEDFGNKDVKFCATFVLLKPKTEGKMEDTSLAMNTTVTRKTLKYTQGTRVFVRSGMRDQNEDSIISFTFGCGQFFTIDSEVKPGSIVCRHYEDEDEEPSIGIAIYTDFLPHPFQVFPLCISLDHLLTEECITSCCTCTPSSTTFIPKGPRIAGMFIVQCGSRAGSGFLIGQGIIVTCAHILFDKDQSSVTVYWNNVSSKADIIYMNAGQSWPDIALLEISSTCFDATSILTIASRPLAIGERVLVAGIPCVKGWYRPEPWISCGRIVKKVAGQIITSCSVHKGFSGGCLRDLQGEVLGVIVGKAFPANETCKPPRLTQVLPITSLKHQILSFIDTTPRTQTDVENLTKAFLLSRELNHKL